MAKTLHLTNKQALFLRELTDLIASGNDAADKIMDVAYEELPCLKKQIGDKVNGWVAADGILEACNAAEKVAKEQHVLAKKAAAAAREVL